MLQAHPESVAFTAVGAIIVLIMSPARGDGNETWTRVKEPKSCRPWVKAGRRLATGADVGTQG